MTQNMITVALIVGNPGHEGLQLNEGSLAAAPGRRGSFLRQRPGARAPAKSM